MNELQEQYQYQYPLFVTYKLRLSRGTIVRQLCQFFVFKAVSVQLSVAEEIDSR